MSRLAARVLVAGIVAAAIGVLVGVGGTGPARSSAPQQAGGVTVTGQGAVTTTPDRAVFSFGVTTQAATATVALQRNGEAIQKVIAALKAHGVADANIQTQVVSLSPRTSDKGEIVGYTASNAVSAQATVERAGEVIDAAVAAGATDVSGPSLTRTDQDVLYRQALKAAVADARAKAQVLAGAAGVGLGAVTSIVEGSSAPVPVPLGRTEAPATPVQPGTERIEATVTVTFAVA